LAGPAAACTSGARKRARVAVRVAADLRRVVHVADRAGADQVDLLADGEVGLVEVGQRVGGRAEHVGPLWIYGVHGGICGFDPVA
jgi:hypothetical protein